MLQLVLLAVLLLLSRFPSLLSVQGPHIADVNLLLPPRMTYPVEYRLQGSDGCFSWSWDHHDILSVQPEYNASSHCSTSARVRSIAPYGGRKETAIYASDKRSGTVIRCKVFIDQISRIQIFHSSVKLDLDGLATLRIRAFDSEENVFSSLVGLQFMWHLMPQTDGDQHHLAHVPLKDSPLSDYGGFCGDLIIQIKLEDSGVYSDLYVVKGTEIGHEIVSAHVHEPLFEHLEDKIVLTVAEAMSIDPPSPVFVISGASVHYSLKVIRQNVPQVVTLPSPYHQWSVLNSSVAQVDTTMGLAHALDLGATTVTVEDIRVAGHVQISSLHVVIPDALYLYMVPVSISGAPVEGIEAIPSTMLWYAVVGQQYVIHVKVFSLGPIAQEIHLTESDDIKLDYNQPAYWDTFMVPDGTAVKHGWQSPQILMPTSEGLGRLTASLAYPMGRAGTKEVITVVQEVMVCDKLKFKLGNTNDSSHSIRLPWAPGVYQEMMLRVTGGCAKTFNDYKWHSSDVATVSVSASGVVQAKKPGQATIKVTSVFDSLNYDEVVIEVFVPSSMVMLQDFPVETVVGTHLQAAVTLKTSNGAYFSNCDAFSSFIKWKTGSDSFRIVNSTSETLALDKLLNIKGFKSLGSPPCAWTFIYASTSGRTMLHATLSKELKYFDHSVDGPIVLKASSHIAAYPPLTVKQAGNGNQFGGYSVDLDRAAAGTQLENLDEIYLVAGTELDVMLTGGPERWSQGVEFVEHVEIFYEEHNPILNESVVHWPSPSRGGLYRLSCQTLGGFKLVFSRGNLVGDDHPLPAIEKVELSLMCDFPSSIALIANEPVSAPDVVRSAVQADRSPGRIQLTPITVANGCTIRLAAVGVHSSGKAFANSSSLYLKWELLDCDKLAYWDDADALEKSRASWERFLVLQNASGLCVVRATVIGFSTTISGRLFEEASSLLKDSRNLTDAIRLQLVSTLRVIPEWTLLFFSPDAKLNLSITGGTCFLNAVVNDTQVVEVIQPPPSLECLQLMLAPRGIGTALVTVHDIGLAPPLAASAVVQVADVDWIRIISEEEISLMDGDAKSFDILAGVRDGNAFDSSQYVYMNIRLHIEDPILELVNGDQFPSSGGEHIYVPTFVIQAKHLGVTTMYVSATQHSGHEILSQPIKVEVYAPPKIHPEDIFLVPGASYMLTMKGGPTIRAFIEFACMDDAIATINRTSGRLSAISPGTSTLLATVYGNGDTVICQTHGRVKVGIPSLMILSVQSEQLGVGREMPIFPSLPEGNLFSFYELCNSYKWFIDDEQVLSFRGHSHGDKIEVPFSSSKEIHPNYPDEKDLGFIKVLHGRSAGRTNVAVSFSCNFHSSDAFSQSKSFNASALIWVVPDPPLSLGLPMTWILPPFYTMLDPLPASSESYNQRDFLGRKGTIIYSLLRACGEKNKDMQQDSISIDGGRIKTTESNNIACIQAKDRTTGRTEIATCVRVAEVAQIRITEGFPFHIADLAVGDKLELLVSYCDDLGSPFHEAYGVVQAYAETNYPDIVSICDTCDNKGRIHLKAMHHGRALVRISIHEQSEKSDYMMISVGAHLHPQNPVLPVGHYLNFSIEGLSDEVYGQWMSANESVLSIDMVSGEAHAVGEGATQVIFESSSLKLQTIVSVQRMNLVLVDAPAETLTNVHFPTKGYSFLVRLSDTQGHKFGALGNRNGILYDCRVDPPFVGYAKPWRDLDTGISYCLFLPYSPEHLAHSMAKSKAMRPDISISVNASLIDAESVMGSAPALFVGGFSILGMSKELMQLNLTLASNKSFITVVGNTDVEIHWQGRDLILVSPIYREDHAIGGRAVYEVKALRAERFKDKIIITLPATGQRAELNVSYDPGEGGGGAGSKMRSFAIWAAIVGSFTALILTVAFFMWSLDRPDRSQQSLPATPSVAAPVTPERSTVGYSSEQSPRTPQPFIEYVRRTIDETPYYRREGRRRFNAQNTF
ncbi:nuclear pore complex protein GP210 [Macadamia integrifolia]|uniref:nuclear pore complex protein GP210 n=1 Tax=Macadamia integrifolia TaxID=60698 RepID=UPI001C4FC752|nr:nuclear pore complex protein GP210 [Macadamia integrifolia]